MASIKAVGEIHNENGDNKYRLFLKAKDPEHVPLILSDKEISSLLDYYDLELIPKVRVRHDIETVIEESDIFLSIGFTTPGLDALLLGKPSAYFTPYNDFNYNAIFNNNTLVLHNVSEIKSFLKYGNVVDQNILDGLDPFRDGKASLRLASFVNELLRDEQDAN